MTPARARRGPLLLAALVVVGLSLLNPLSASAAPVPAGAAAAIGGSVPDSPAPATVTPVAHRCTTFGSVVAGYVAAHCADIDVLTGDIRGLGQAFCQRASDHVNVRCAAIVQLITFTGSDGEVITSGNKKCGSYGGSACPATTSFSNVTLPLSKRCSEVYQTTVRTTILLPGSVATSRSPDFQSYATAFPC
jgi:hypothetical protein